MANCTFEDSLLKPFNGSTLSGYTYENYLLKRTKDKAVSSAYLIAKRRWDNIEYASRNNTTISRDNIIPSLYSIGARNKREYDYEDEDACTSRAVHMPEFHTEICTGIWTDQITDYLTEIGRGAIFVGNSYIRYERLKKVLTHSKSVFEGDWKRFDSTLYKNMIIIGVSFMRAFYDHKSKRIDNHFLAIGDTVLIKDYVLPGGNINRLTHGIPSGVKITHNLGSIINLISLAFCVGTENIKRTDFIVGGDDFLISNTTRFKGENFKESFIERSNILGMQVKFLDKKYTDSDILDELPCFYKYVVSNNRPVTPTTALLERVLMPWNRKVGDIYELIELYDDFIPTLAAPSSACLIFYAIYSKLIEIGTGTKYPIYKSFKKHKRIYEQIMMRGKLSEIQYKDASLKCSILRGKYNTPFDNKLNKIFWMNSSKRSDFIKLSINKF